MTTQKSKLRPFFTFFLFFLLSLLFYFFFVISYPSVHQKTLIDEALINPWLRGRVFGDGYELPVMFVASIVYVLLAWIIVKKTIARHPGNSERSVEASRISQSNRRFWTSQNDGLIRILIGMALITFSIIILFPKTEASMWDYSFFIAPGLKLHFGEQLGTFYMRYNLLMAYMFKWMMDFGLRLSHMQLVMSLSNILFVVLYLVLGLKVIKNRILVLVFLIALMIVRFLATPYDVSAFPQSSPLRLDLFVIPLIIASYYGLNSIWTAGAFSLIYIADNQMGLFYLIAYMLALISQSSKLKAQNNNSKLKTFTFNFSLLTFHFKLIVPILLSFLLQFFLFHSFITPASLDFAKAQVDFIPISYNSAYFLIMLFLPYYLWSMYRMKERGIYLLILLISLFQLIYFYGRSHENNLLSISGIFVLMLFIALDQLKNQRLAQRTGLFLVCLSVIVFSKSLVGTRTTIKIHSLDRAIDARTQLVKQIGTDRLYFFGVVEDSYYHYRFHIPQPEYYVPLVSSIYIKDSIDTLSKVISDGYTVVVVNLYVPGVVEQFNNSQYGKDQRIHFDVINRGDFYEVGLSL